jgi:hypothetical protein
MEYKLIAVPAASRIKNWPQAFDKTALFTALIDCVD